MKAMVRQQRRKMVAVMLPTCTVQYSTVQYSTVQYSTVQCNATHHEALPGLAAGAGGRDGRHPGGVIGGDQTI